jgi:hypothetical protein
MCGGFTVKAIWAEIVALYPLTDGCAPRNLRPGKYKGLLGWSPTKSPLRAVVCQHGSVQVCNLWPEWLAKR